MEFHSARFALFFTVVFAGYWLLSGRRAARNLLLLAASWLFYSAWETWFLALIGFSTVLDWFCGRWIHGATSRARRRLFLLLSLTGNLSLLAWFKYSGWAADGVRALFEQLGVDPAGLDWVWEGVVPVGISFYTFQTLSYTIDIYRGTLQPARSFRELALFVAFFPQLVAGPIVRASHFLPQLELLPRFDRERLHDGLYRIALGIGKKVLVADVVGRLLVDPVYAAPEQYAPSIHLLALYGFAFQIFCDFSGYSDVAIGAARLLGFDLPENFRRPYRATSIREYWRRWHISLSSWIRDYVFIPMGGSRGTPARVARNLMITMLLVALWHGASLLWVVYGILHGGMLVFERWLDQRRGGRPFATTALRKLVVGLATFQVIAASLAFVRARDGEELRGVFSVFGGSTDISPVAWVALGAAVLGHYLPDAVIERTERAVKALPTPLLALLFGLACGAFAFAISGDTPFIYFQF